MGSFFAPGNFIFSRASVACAPALWLGILLLGGVIFLAGCENGNAPSYQNQRSLILMDACEAILQEKDEDALAALKQLREMEDGDRFTTEATLAVLRRKNRTMVMKLLQNGDYEGLRVFMREQMSSGSADSSSILEKEIPEALQALALYCAKMPWEEPKPMEDALVLLDRHHLLLSRSENYKLFRENQQQHLLDLRVAWQKKQAQELCEQWSKSYLQGDERTGRQILSQWQREQPDHPLFAYQARLLRKEMVTQIPAENAPFYAMAVVLTWERIRGLDLQKQALLPLYPWEKEMADAQAPLGLFLLGREKKDFSGFLAVIRQKGWILGSRIQKMTVVKK